MNFVELFTMSVYIITLTLVNFSRVLDEIGAINLASVSGLFASFRLQNDSCLPRQTPLVFHIGFPFSWQSLDLFLGLFSGFGRNLLWQVDDVVEFVQICHFFMVSERFLHDIFRACYFNFPPDYCYSFRENQFCEVLFALKSSGYVSLARHLMSFASIQYEDIFVFEDLVTATSVAAFRCSVDRRFGELDQSSLLEFILFLLLFLLLMFR